MLYPTLLVLQNVGFKRGGAADLWFLSEFEMGVAILSLNWLLSTFWTSFKSHWGGAKTVWYCCLSLHKKQSSIVIQFADNGLDNDPCLQSLDVVS